MNFKKIFGITLPMVALTMGGALLAINSGSKVALETDAAQYSTSERALEADEDGVYASFTISDDTLGDVRGWLLCLFEDEPNYNFDTRKLVGSDDLHPFNDASGCSHYFFVSNNFGSGNINLYWGKGLADQKDGWTEGQTYGEEGKTLADYWALRDWHIVIGPRVHNDSWHHTDEEGAGKDGYWENCDYYVGRKNALLNGVDGQTYLDLSNFQGWEADDAKFAFYYFNSTTDGWSDFAVETAFDHIYVAQYSLGFVPTSMIAVRLKSTATTPNWDDKDNQGDNMTFYECGVIGVDRWKEYWETKEPTWAYEMAAVKVNVDKVVALDHLKRNGTYSENFNQAISLTGGDTFVISFADKDYYNFSTHSSLEDKFNLDEENHRIEVLQSGNYSLYFNTDLKTLSITSINLIKADEWAQSFLGDSCADTKTNWSDLDWSYNHLDDAVQEIFETEPHISHDAEAEGCVALAMQRYDFLVENFEGYDDFISRETYQGITPFESESNIVANNDDNNNSLMVIITIISLSALSLVTLLVLKKKRLSK